ncbi:hypothetical protein E4U47_004489 [Claviceps purpurea]|nr:hypothetical protein E4U47_004489 [Claviceps purpurea]
MAPSALAWTRHPRKVDTQVPDGTRLWIVVGVIAGILVVTGIATIIIVSFIKCRRRCRRRPSTPSPYKDVSAKEWARPRLPTAKSRSDLSVADALDPEFEQQRTYLIQKSLASRARAESQDGSSQPDVRLKTPRDDLVQKPPNCLNPSNTHGRDASTAQLDKARPATQQSQRPKLPVGLADNLKEWEARVQQDGDRPLPCHPALRAEGPNMTDKNVERGRSGK